jgi:hypothetical protein
MEKGRPGKPEYLGISAGGTFQTSGDNTREKSLSIKKILIDNEKGVHW